MTGNHHYAELARRRFESARRDAPPRLPADRRRLVGAVEQALRARGRRRTVARWWTAGGLVAVAAAAAFVLAPRFETRLGRSSSAPVAPVDPRRFTVLGTGTALDIGTALRAPAADELRIGTPEGTSLVLEPGSGLTIVEAGATQRLALSSGAVRAHVAKLGAGQRFVIQTDDAEVEVRGTTFRVARGEADPRCPSPRTHVSVSEGVVTVASGAHAARLSAGADWSGACEAAVAAPLPASALDPPTTDSQAPDARPLDAEPVSSRVRRRPGATAAKRASASGAAARAPDAAVVEPPPIPSVLGAQNDLFAAAVHARRQGDAMEALRLFSAFIQRYPRSPLYEHALAQKMKLLVTTDPWAASEAASEYLARFPAGFARGEARALQGRAGQP